MSSSTVTSKGQITIPVEIRRELGLHAGSRIDFVRNQHGRFEIRPKKGSIRDLKGFLAPAARTLTVEQMDDAIGKAVTE